MSSWIKMCKSYVVSFLIEIAVAVVAACICIQAVPIVHQFSLDCLGVFQMASSTTESSNPSELTVELSTAEDNSSSLLISSPVVSTTISSKRAAKRLERRQRLSANKSEWRKAQKLKKKANRAKMSLSVDLSLTPKPKFTKMVESNCKIAVAIDCSFDNYMSEKDCRMLLKQLCSCYGINRRAKNPLQLHFTSFRDKSRELFQATQGANSWDVHVHIDDYIKVFSKDRIVYLSSESPNTLMSLNEEKVYVIGGLVDHNHHKGLCYQNALQLGVAHAKLPLEEFVNLKTRKVLTVNQVFEIIVRYLEVGSWQTAIMKVLPPRKGATVSEIQSTIQEDSNETLNGSIL